MKRNLLAATIAALSFSSIQAGEAVFYISEDGQAVKDISVKVDGKKKLVGKNGFISFELKGDLKGDRHQVELSQFGEWAGEFEFNANNNQNAEIQVEMIGGEAVADVALYVPGKDNGDSSTLGHISGTLESDETGGGVEAAIISVVGTTYTTTTDNQGFYQLEIPRGEYTLKIAHPSYGNREVKSLRVISQVATTVNLNLSMSGDGVIEEVVAVGSYIPSTATTQERDSSAILDAIGSEQFSRFGDSNAASALKRVAGVTVADGKYVVVRGLNERHSTIMLNGASLPSPDPSRRVVPLDIFPSSMLSGIEVQKSFTANVYADSTGGVVKLSTKKFPSEFEGNFSFSTSYTDGLTGEGREFQKTDGLDALGFGSSGDRELPGDVRFSEVNLANDNLSSAQKTALTQEFADNLATEQLTVRPDISMEMSMGNTLIDSGSYTLGYTASLKYSNEWSKQDSERASYEVQDGELVAEDQFNYLRTANDINLGGSLSAGVVTGEHEYTSNTMLLRQTHIETSNIEGVVGDQSRDVKRTNMRWLERQFVMQQFTGDHFLDFTVPTQMNWQVSVSQATLDAPDERSYSFEGSDEDPMVLELSSTDRIYTELTDDNTDVSINFSSEFIISDDNALELKYGLSTFNRTRDAETIRIGYSDINGGTNLPSSFDGVTDIDDVINDETISDGTIAIRSETNPSDSYDATWDLTALYLMTEFTFGDWSRWLIGARSEDSKLQVNTFTTASTINNPEAISAKVDDSDLFPSINSTFYVGEELQFRLGYYQTKNRPDFRELANASFVDPEDGDVIKGNPDLVSTMVDNFDARAEWYFNDSESVSISYFLKDFEQPIEKTLTTGANIFSFDNAESGELSGFEIDFKKEFELTSGFSSFVSGNYAQIDSEVEIVVDTVNKTQAMQGQPENLMNFQLGLDDLEGGREYTVVYNHQGESLYAVSGRSLPNIMREARGELNVNFTQEFNNGMKLKGKLKNILDEEVSLTQGGENYRSYKKGSEITLGISMPL